MPQIYFAQYTSRAHLGYTWGETAAELNRTWLDIFLSAVTGQHLFPENGNAIGNDFLGGFFSSSIHNFGVVFRFLNGGRDDVGRSGVVTINALFFDLGRFHSRSLKGLFEHPQLADPSCRSVSTGIFLETAFPGSRFQRKPRYTKPDELYDALSTRYECDTFLLVGHKEGTIGLSPLSQPSFSRENLKKKTSIPTSPPRRDSGFMPSSNIFNLKSVSILICIGVCICGYIGRDKLKSYIGYDKKYIYSNSDMLIGIRQDGDTPIIQVKSKNPPKSMPQESLPSKGEDVTIRRGGYEFHIQTTSKGIDIKCLRLQGDNLPIGAQPNYPKDSENNKESGGPAVKGEVEKDGESKK